jgi:hypothetical protein
MPTITQTLLRSLLAICGACLLAASAWAQCPSKTTVSDTLLNADGSPASGRVVIAWPTFLAGTCQVIAGQTTVTVNNGLFSVELYPNDAAAPMGTSYRVTYYLKSGRISTEYWVVPVNSIPVNLASVRASSVPSPAVMFGQAQVINLITDLSRKVELPSPCPVGKFLQANGSSVPPQVSCVDGSGAPLATLTQSGTVKTDVTQSDPRVYTKATLDVLLAGKAPTTHTHAASDLTSGVLNPGRLPTPTSSTLGGLKSGACPDTHKMTGISETGSINCAPDQLGSSSQHQVNGANLLSNDPVNFQDTTEVGFTNPSAGNLQAALKSASVAPSKLSASGASNGDVICVSAGNAAWCAPSGYDTIQEEGSGLTARRKLNFVGSSITCSDDPANTATQCAMHAMLNALADLASTGLLVRTGSGALAARTITSSSPISVSNGDGTSGNPEISCPTCEVTGGKGAASGYASLDASSLVVQNPANATATPTASKIPIADTGGKLADGWLSSNVTLGGNSFTGTGNLVRAGSPALTTPSIADFTNATHNHQSSAGGGTLDTAAIASGTLGSARGGTGSGFTKFSGPTTSEKIFTLPDASATVLTTNAAVTSAQGGTGANNTATSGRYLKGDGTNFVTSSGAASGTGSCTNQVVTGTNSDAAPTCTTITSGYTSGTFAPTAHNLLSTSHGDSTAASVTRGGLITGQGSSATWSLLAIGTQYKVLQAGANEIGYDAVHLDQSTAVTGILPSANGGTANAYFTVSGPATPAKTFTFPNASATVLTSNAAVTATQGGTGQSTTATSGRYLKGDGTNWGTSSGSASGTGACTSQFVRTLNSDAAPTCAAVSLTADISGTLPLGNGGTGQTSFSAGLVRSSGTALSSAELSGDVTTSGSNVVTIANNAVTSAKTAVVNTRRTCVIENDTQSATPLTNAQITGRCDVMAASTLVEIAVYASGGTPTVLLERWRPNGGAVADLLSTTLPTVGSGAYACAMATISQTCIAGITSSGTITLSNTALAAGDVIRVKSATAGGTATWHHIVATWVVN